VNVFPVHGNSPVCRGPTDGDIKEIYLVVCLAFRCELESQVYCTEVPQHVLDVCVVGVVDNQYIVYVSEIFYDLIFVRQV